MLGTTDVVSALAMHEVAVLGTTDGGVARLGTDPCPYVLSSLGSCLARSRYYPLYQRMIQGIMAALNTTEKVGLALRPST